MSFPSDSPAVDEVSLPPGTLLLLGAIIQERTGLQFDDNRHSVLLDKLKPLVLARGFRSYLDYYYFLKYDNNAAFEWRRLTDSLLVQETYFWREIEQIQAIAEQILPRLASSWDRPLRIWCAACATGEEPLTMAIVLNEAGWFRRANIEIHASDVSLIALQKARQGLYRERALRNLPLHLRDKYFTRENELWRIAPELLARIQWRNANLIVKSEIIYLATAPIVLCRNVFIYFSERTIRQVVGWFAEAMPSPGYLGIGASESLLRLTNTFTLEEIGNAFMYVKE